MEKRLIPRCDSPIKSSRKGDYKVQFVDASEYCVSPAQAAVSSKPPEIPRSSSSSLRSNTRSSSSTSSSTGNLTYNSNSLSIRLNKGNNVSSCRVKNDSFGSTTSLDRRRQNSSKERSIPLQPLAKRSQSLDRRQRPLDTDSVGDKRKKTSNNSLDNRKVGSSTSYQSPYGIMYCSSTISQNGSHERPKYRPKTCQSSYKSNASPHSYNSDGGKVQAIGAPTGVLEGRFNHDRDWLQKMKRAASRSPHRSKAGKSVKDDNKERLSRHSESDGQQSRSDHSRERGHSTTPRHTLDDCSNTNL